MQTILGFDSWLGGAGKFARIVPALRERGYRLVLLHIGSWGGDPGRPTKEFHDDLEIRDISYYGGRRFDEILAIEKPAAVLFLSNDVFAHRSFNRYSQLIGVPSIHLYHGMHGVQAVNSAEPFKVNLFSQIRYVLVRVPKALIHIWPCYVRALYKTGARKADWLRFFSDIINLARGKYIAHAAPDSLTSAACVYTHTDISHAVGKYGYRPEHVHVVGNPDIAAFGLTADQIAAAATVPNVQRPEIIYVDTGLIYAGMVYENAEDFFVHLCATRDALRMQGRTMSIKLHPQHFRTDFPDRLRAADIEVLGNDNFVPRLLQCAAAIVEPSTAALIPAVIGVPLLLARYGKLAAQAYGDVLLEYPRARLLDDPSRLNSLLQAEAVTMDANAVRAWITRNAGPLPAHLMPQRVAEVVHQLVQSSKENN